MARIDDKIKAIREARQGRDVRESIASGLEAMNEESSEAISKASTAQDSATNSAAAAAGSATEASGYATAASTSASNAASSATEASGYASNAASSATEASGYASTADAKATEASGYATAASTSASNAAGSASTASSKASEAAASATAADTSASNAAGSASTASTKATEAAASATEASTSASNAAGSASTASTKASEAASSATNASNSASTAQGYVTDALGHASAAALSAQAADTSATAASTSASNAAGSATNASNSATQASNSASMASNAQSEASTSASNAAASASAAAESASNAATSAEGAEYYYEEAKKILSITYRYKGSVQTREDLPSDPSNGDVYNIIDESGQNVAWSSDENKWDELGSTIDLSDYAKTVDVVAKNQGVASKDKILGIDSNGNVIPIDNYALPTASTSTKGGVKVDGVSVKVDSEVLSSNANIITCSTALNTVAKTASLSNFVLKAGVRVFVTFTDTTTTAPTSGDITLNINNTGAKNIYYILTNSGKTKCTYSHAKYFYNNQTHEFVYDGTNWLMFNGIDANTKNSTGTSEKAATKLYLAGGTSQNSSGVTTYSNAKVYIGTNNELYSNGQRVAHDYATETKTLSKSAWSGSVAPYTYDLGYDSTVDIEIMLPSTATAAQVEAVVAAQIAGNGSDNIIRAWGEKPNVDIPIIVRKVVK